MDFYGVLLFVHVGAVIMWVGTGVVFQLLSEGAFTDGTPNEDRVRTLVNLGEAFGGPYFGILTGVVFLSGLWLVFDGDWSFSEPFVLGGIVGIVASGALGGAVIGPTSQRLQKRVRESGTIDAGAAADGMRLRSFGRVDMAIMVIVVFLMTAKPGT